MPNGRCCLELERLLFCFFTPVFLLIGFIRFLFGFFLRLRLCLILKEDFICKAQLHRLLCIHPCLIGHELCDLLAGDTALAHIGIDDAFLDLVKRCDSLFHIGRIPHGNRHGIVDHQHGDRTHENRVPRHGNHGSRRCSNRIDLHRDPALVVFQHRVDFSSGEDRAARRIDPDGNVTFLCFQLITECLWSDLVSPEIVLINRTVQSQHPAAAVIVNPVPKFLQFPYLRFRGCAPLLSALRCSWRSA